ncbi:MAG: hypothetical protein JWN26_710 [Candidatus Saccharibacteria bacterium]|nr:hypothetical protein [Candidatus Saccharibacteria bacterium]
MPEVFRRKAHATQDPKMPHHRDYGRAYLHYNLDKREPESARCLDRRHVHYVSE